MGNLLLVIGATLSGLAALLHVGCIVFGASWYRFFGAGERMAQLAATGSWRPAFITTFMALVLSAWSLYALSGAGVIPRLPLVRLGLCVITGIYLLRAVAGFWLAMVAACALDDGSNDLLDASLYMRIVQSTTKVSNCP